MWSGSGKRSTCGYSATQLQLLHVNARCDAKCWVVYKFSSENVLPPVSILPFNVRLLFPNACHSAPQAMCARSGTRCVRGQNSPPCSLWRPSGSLDSSQAMAVVVPWVLCTGPPPAVAGNGGGVRFSDFEGKVRRHFDFPRSFDFPALKVKLVKSHQVPDIYIYIDIIVMNP